MVNIQKSVHDRLKPITLKYVKAFEFITYIVLIKRRFICHGCKYKFTEQVTIQRENKNISNKVEQKVLKDLKQYNLSLNYNAEEMLYVINLAKALFFDNKRRWNQLVERGMNKDFSWGASKKRYEELYNHLMAVRAEELRMLEEKRAEELRIMEEERKRAEAEAKEALAKKEAAEEEE